MVAYQESSAEYQDEDQHQTFCKPAAQEAKILEPRFFHSRRTLTRRIQIPWNETASRGCSRRSCGSRRWPRPSEGLCRIQICHFETNNLSNTGNQRRETSILTEQSRHTSSLAKSTRTATDPLLTRLHKQGKLKECQNTCLRTEPNRGKMA